MKELKKIHIDLSFASIKAMAISNTYKFNDSEENELLRKNIVNFLEKLRNAAVAPKISQGDYLWIKHTASSWKMFLFIHYSFMPDIQIPFRYVFPSQSLTNANEETENNRPNTKSVIFNVAHATGMFRVGNQ